MTEQEKWMALAIEISKKGEGLAEPNPMVGCVLVKDGSVVGKGWHKKFGGPHAEVEAVMDAGENAEGSTAYVTLEPCCHYGKTPPCSKLLVESGIKKVYVACRDPNPKVSGGGFQMLESAGIPVISGVLEDQARKVLSPFLKSMTEGLPWVIAKWAMTLDGKIASHTGHSRWITGPDSRALVHEIRSRCDGVVVGSGTVLADDPLLNYRPSSPDSTPRRIATRIVFDRRLRTPINSKLVQTATQIPVIIATSANADQEKKKALIGAGCEIWEDSDQAEESASRRFLKFLNEKGMTNLLVEGGGYLLGTFFDEGLVDEVYSFVAPKIVGGQNALSPIGGIGKTNMDLAVLLDDIQTEQLGPDILIRGRVKRSR